MRHDGPVVIAVDGYPHSTQTLEWGLDEAQMRGADVVLARAYQEPYDYAAWNWYPIPEDLRFDTEAKEYLADQLERARASRPGLTITTRLLHGPEVPQLQGLATDAQLLVVGARGSAGHARVGRVSAHLAAHARCSVAVVREVPGDPGPVVVGVDGSPSSLAAAAVAAREAVGRGAPLVVLHARRTVLAPFYGEEGLMPPLATADENDPTHRAALEVVASLRERYPELGVRLELLDDDPAHALTSASSGARLVVVGSRGMGAFRGMLLGAVSNEVVRSAASTVLVVHDEAAD